MLSVITATYQAERSVAALVRSLEEQEFRDFEWVVRDGGSTDATGAIVQAASVPSLRYTSEPDGGIYDAFNRAVGEAAGRYVLFLGADDRLREPRTLSRVAAALGYQSTRPDALLCSVVDERGKRFVSRLSALTLVINTVHHQGVVYNRKLFDEFRYRTDSPVVADYELNLLLKLQRRFVVSLDLDIAECDSGGVSHTSDEWGLYRDLHDLRAGHLPRAASAVLMAVGLGNVTRRRLLAQRSWWTCSPRS